MVSMSISHFTFAHARGVQFSKSRPLSEFQQGCARLAAQAVPNPKREDVDAITDYFNINAGNPVQCLTQARLPGRTPCQWCVRTERGAEFWHLLMCIKASACCSAGRVGSVLSPMTTAVPRVLGRAGGCCMGACMGEVTSAPALHLEPV